MQNIKHFNAAVTPQWPVQVDEKGVETRGGFTDVRVIKQQNNHIKRSETLQSDRCHCRQDYSVQEEVGTCEEGGRNCEEEDL